MKLYPKKDQPKPINDKDVPIPLVDLMLVDWKKIDLTLSKIIPFIDGSTEILSISQLSDSSLSLVKKAIQHLLYYNFLVVVDLYNVSFLDFTFKKIISKMSSLKITNT